MVAWSGGAYDLVQKVRAGGMYAGYIKKAFGDSESAWRDASPVSHVGDVKRLPPFLFVSIEKGNASTLAAEHLAGSDSGGRRSGRHPPVGKPHPHDGQSTHRRPDDTTGMVLLGFVRKVSK